MSKTVYLFDGQGRFSGNYDAQESPLEPGVFLVPANATTNPPPACADGEIVVFEDGSWLVKAIPAPPPVEPPTAYEITFGKILALEATVTNRRIREAVLGIDGGWLKSLNDQCAALREELRAL